jgi:hypothetical protein
MDGWRHPWGIWREQNLERFSAWMCDFDFLSSSFSSSFETENCNVAQVNLKSKILLSAGITGMTTMPGSGV